MKIIQKDPKTLTPSKHNARVHEPLQVKQIIASISEYGFTNPVLIDPTGGIIAGHGRIQAALEMGLKKVPTITLENLSPAQLRAYILADNKIALNAEWDEELLLSELQDLLKLNVDFEHTGFSVDEYDALLLASLTGDDEETQKGIGETGEVDDSVMFACPVTDAQYETILDAVLIAKGQDGKKHTGVALTKICREWAKVQSG